jgi:hypothetical protein
LTIEFSRAEWNKITWEYNRVSQLHLCCNVGFLAANFGNFTYLMKMYKTESYNQSYDDYPVLVLASQRIFFQTEVVAKDADLVLLVENCKVTPSKDRNDKEFYVIIEKG